MEIHYVFDGFMGVMSECWITTREEVVAHRFTLVDGEGEAHLAVEGERAGRLDLSQPWPIFPSALVVKVADLLQVWPFDVFPEHPESFFEMRLQMQKHGNAGRQGRPRRSAWA